MSSEHDATVALSQIERFGAAVLTARRSAEMSQADLAKAAGCSVIMLRMLEREEVVPDQRLAEKIAKALGIPPPAPQVVLTHVFGSAAVEADVAFKVEEGSERRGYRFEKLLGEGGFGAVYSASQESVGREVAVKLILPKFANKPEFVRRFEAEARMVAALEHPHIVPLYDYWREPNGAFLVMRFLRGGSLHDRMGQGPMSLAELMPVLKQLAGAMHAAHRGGVIHRDIKPANLLLDADGNAYLADFGVAKSALLDDEEKVDGKNQVFASIPYAAPELLAGDDPVPGTDIYAFGITIYELIAGVRPFRAATHQALVELQMYAQLPPLSALVPGMPLDVDYVLQRACAKALHERYDNVVQFIDELGRAGRDSRVRAAVGDGFAPDDVSTIALTPTAETQATTIDDRDNPYLGLRAFSEADSENFFGRESLIERLIARLREEHDLNRFLAVIGASGSGKSSVVRAGVWPQLRKNALPGSKNWFYVDLMPGSDPFGALEQALLRVAVNPPSDLGGLLRGSVQGLVKAVDKLLPADPGVELVMLIDQFEEVFTQVADEAERSRFLDSLTCAILDPKTRLRVMITLRADFLEPAISHADLGELLQQRGEYALPFTPDELERAITGPAKRAGMALEPGLADAIIAEVADQPGALPLMQFALSELFVRRSGVTLSMAAYQELGGVRGALTRKADEVFSALDDAAQKQARQMMLRLVTLGEGAEDTRRRETRRHLLSLSGENSEAMQRALDALGKSRLLNFDRDPFSGEPTVDVAHEALIRSWKRLRGWLAEARDELRASQRLQQSAQEWQNAGRDPSFLVAGSKLDQLAHLATSENVVLARSEREYLEAALTARDAAAIAEAQRAREELARAKALAEEQARARQAAEKLAEAQRRAAQRLKVFLAAVGGLLAIAVGLTALTLKQKSDLRLTTERANREATTATEVSGFLGTIFATADPNQSKGKEVTVREVLDKALPRVSQELAEQPLVQARLLFTMGSSYRQLGAFDEAVEALGQATAQVRKSDDATLVERTDIELEYARILADVRRNDEALTILKETVAEMREKGERSARLATPLSIIGSIYNDRFAFLKAEPFVREALVLRAEFLPDSPQLAIVYNNLGIILLQTGRPEEALTQFEKAYDIRARTLGLEHIETVVAELNIGNALRELVRFEESIKRLDAAIAMITQLTGNNHPVRAAAMFHKAVLRKLSGDLPGSQALLDEVYAIQQSVFGDTHSILASVLLERADVKLQRRDLAAAQADLAAVRIVRNKMADDDPEMAEYWRLLAELGRAQGAPNPIAAQAAVSGRRAKSERSDANIDRRVMTDLVGALLEQSRTAVATGDAVLTEKALMEADSLLGEPAAVGRELSLEVSLRRMQGQEAAAAAALKTLEAGGWTLMP